ncbi:hypothetical protein AAG906_019691 [Vitis piasezkii]
MAFRSKLLQVMRNFDERLNFRFLGVKEARITLNDQYMVLLFCCFCFISVSSNFCMPYWIRDQEGRLLDICVNIMDPPPEDQNSQQGQGSPILCRFYQFSMEWSENPYAHIKEEEVCNTFREGGASIDLMRLKLFPFTLKDKAKIWLNSLRPRSIRNWVDLQPNFEEIFPTHRTNGLKRQISNFSAKENEKFHECWERYMEAINACPHHGFDTWLLVSYFYDGMSSSMKQILETMCGGDFMSKNPEEAMDFLSYVSEVSRGWDEPNSREKGKFPSQPTQNPKGGMYVLSEDMDMKAKVATIARRLEELELKKMHEVQAISETQAHAMPCTICQSCDHVVDEPNNNAPYGNTYNSSWRNHPNFSWKPRPPPYQPQAQTQAPQQTSSWSKPLLTNLNTVNEKGKFPSQPSQNPKGVHEVETQEGESSKLREVKADHFKEQDEELMSKKTLVKESNNQEEKSGKKRLHVTKNAFLTEQVSAIIQSKSPVKYKDPGCPTISVNIGGTHVEKALLDLGASVNLLPYSVYKQLGLGGLKPTAITLSLADRSVKIPRGVIEDVLVQVDKFYYPVDFVVLDTDPIVKEANYVPIILGRPFLATSNAIINCRNGVMQLTFGNMTLELNIFHLCKRHLHPEEEEGLEEVCLINTLVEEHCDKNLQESLSESLEMFEEGLPEPSDVLAIMSPWRRKEEILPLFNEEDSKGVAREDPPKLVLKPLPVDLNANFIWDPGKLNPDPIFLWT